MPADSFVAQLSDGVPVDMQDVELDGPIDLRRVGVIKAPVRCQRCQFRGPLDATDVVFERLVDLSGSEFQSSVRMQGTLFKEPSSFRAATFLGDVTLASARFLEGASFSSVEFHRQVSFEGVRVAQTGDFSQCRFFDLVTFERAEFDGKSDFSLATFGGEAHFERSDLGSAGSFRGATFSRYVSFERMSAGDSLDFVGAIFEGDANLSNVVSQGTLSLETIKFVGQDGDCSQRLPAASGKEVPDEARPITSTACLLFEDSIEVADLRTEVNSISFVPGNLARKQLLLIIEQSAEARNDLGMANEARFRRLSINGEEKSGLGHLTDRVLYRGVAGYFVEPSHPLSAILLLLLAASLLRGVPRLSKEVHTRRSMPSTAGSGSSSRGIGRRIHDLVLTSEKAAAVLLQGLAASFAMAVRRTPGITIEDPDRVFAYVFAGVAWIEFLSYKVLTAVFLLAVGNSNATVRQLFDAVVSR